MQCETFQRPLTLWMRVASEGVRHGLPPLPHDSQDKLGAILVFFFLDYLLKHGLKQIRKLLDPSKFARFFFSRWSSDSISIFNLFFGLVRFFLLYKIKLLTYFHSQCFHLSLTLRCPLFSQVPRNLHEPSRRLRSRSGKLWKRVLQLFHVHSKSVASCQLNPLVSNL